MLYMLESQTAALSDSCVIVSLSLSLRMTQLPCQGTATKLCVSADLVIQPGKQIPSALECP